jgi:hypothetical protein
VASILVWNDDYGMLPDRLDDCPDECEVLLDRSRIADADAVIFHIPSLRDPIAELPKRPGQRWVAWSMESDANYPVLTDPAFMRNFDLTMTYRRDADIWVPYLQSELLDPGDVAPRSARPLEGHAPAVYIASNPLSLSGRDDYVRELMEHMPVDSYGQCLNNRSWPTDDRGRATKLDTIAQYPFTLAFENSITDDYVTEKFFDPFNVGSVPVYLGAPNIADFAPGEHCFVDVAAFSGPRELAAFLLDLVTDDAAYGAYQAWRAHGARPEYRAMIDRLAPHPLCRLARLLAT